KALSEGVGKGTGRKGVGMAIHLPGQAAAVPERTEAERPAAPAVARRHLRFGWWALLGFLSLGIALEALHGLKVGWYLAASHETRRLLLTLAHAHGVLLALVNIAFGLTVAALRAGEAPWARRASPFLL